RAIDPVDHVQIVHHHDRVPGLVDHDRVGLVVGGVLLLFLGVSHGRTSPRLGGTTRSRRPSGRSPTGPRRSTYSVRDPGPIPPARRPCAGGGPGAVSDGPPAGTCRAATGAPARDRCSRG